MAFDVDVAVEARGRFLTCEAARRPAIRRALAAQLFGAASSDLEVSKVRMRPAPPHHGPRGEGP
jgi:hypothetical protein